jgi:hypothetical protein
VSGVHRYLALTEARTKLFRVADDLLSGRLDRVVLTSRGADDALVVLRASTLARLESEVARSRAGAGDAIPTLFGLARVEGSVDDLLADVRGEAEQRSDSKSVSYGARTAKARRVAERRR